MPLPKRSFHFFVGAAVLAALSMARGPANAQVTTCKTSNCTPGNPGSPILPAECKTPTGQDIASPRMFTVDMNGVTVRFEPENPRLEGRNTNSNLLWDYQCIRWHKVGAAPWHSATEVTAGDTCVDEDACTATNTHPGPCAFETGNIDSASLEWASCHYKQVAPGTYPYKCRLHDILGMVGSLVVVPPIDLRLGKGPGSSVMLEWPTGGSASGPWDVLSDTQPSMPAPTRLSPAAGTAARTFTDNAPPPASVFYMVRECNLKAGVCI